MGPFNLCLRKCGQGGEAGDPCGDSLPTFCNLEASVDSSGLPWTPVSCLLSLVWVVSWIDRVLTTLQMAASRVLCRPGPQPTIWGSLALGASLLGLLRVMPGGTCTPHASCSWALVPPTPRLWCFSTPGTYRNENSRVTMTCSFGADKLSQRQLPHGP